MSTGLKPERGGMLSGPTRRAARVGGGHEEAVVSQRDVRVLGRVPEVAIGAGDIGDWLGVLVIRRIFPERLFVRVVRGRAAGGIAIVLAFLVEASAAMRIVVRHVADDVRVGHALSAPVPAVAGDFTAGVEVVQQHEPLGEGVLVWGDVSSEEHSDGSPLPCGSRRAPGRTCGSP